MNLFWSNDPKVKNPEEIIQEADNMLKNKNILTKISEKFLDNKNNKYEKAISLYSIAGKLFQVQKNWKQAAFSYLKVARCYEKMKKNCVIDDQITFCFYAGTNYMEAAENMRKIDIENALTIYERAKDSFLENGNLYRTAKIIIEIAKLLEENKKSLKAKDETIIEWYKKAEEYFEIENKKFELIKIKEKIAELYGKTNNFEECLKIYEKMIDTLEKEKDNILKYKVIKYIYRYLLCLLFIGDINMAENEFIKFNLNHIYFKDSKEAKFIKLILKAFKDQDINHLDNIFCDLELNKIGSWEANIIFEIKQKIKRIDEDELL